MNQESLKKFLDSKVDLYANPSFIDTDPISIPHSYATLQDIEITAFWTAIFSWGQRKTIINKAKELFSLMGESPYDFIVSHKEKHRAKFLNFKHRTFQSIDTLYFLAWLQQYYKKNESLEKAFIIDQKKDTFSMELSLTNFHNHFFSIPEFPQRTKKHIATPARKSSCKRLNMFLRWMVRPNDNGVDFGLWNNIPCSALHIPLDVHVHRVAMRLGITERKQSDWKTVTEITQLLSKLRPNDPAVYDYALFGLGVLDEDFKYGKV